jgi:threonine synthase
MRYLSTRGGASPQTFTDILLEGLAPDGGLYLPEQIPRFSDAELTRLRTLSYPDLAFEIVSRFAPEWDAEDLRGCVNRAYSVERFGDAAITPVHTLEPGLHLLRLSNGPTLAFKDVAMQLLGELFESLLTRRGEGLNILGATSGDTGSAAEYAMRGKRGVQVFMLSPHGRMSPFQAAQMYSLTDANIHNIAIRGVFDDCQDIVKLVGADGAFKAAHRIGTVNSINWARVAAQAVYYFKGWFAATTSNDQAVSFAVPSGNFGNIYAGWIARAMGVRVRRLIVATNENNVLEEFFRTGRYRVRDTAEVLHTSSPSMDISKSSNFERYMADMVERDPARLRALWSEVDRTGAFDIAGTPLWDAVRASGFVAGTTTHAQRVETIRSIESRYGVVIDPHTANGVAVALRLREAGEPVLCLETALPAKFAETIHEALGREPSRPAGFETVESLPQRVTVLDPDEQAVRRFIVEHT